MSAKKEQLKQLKKERTLIENVIELSKLVILTKHFLLKIRQLKALGSRIGCRLPTIDQLPVLHSEATNRIQEITTTISNQMKTAYTKDKVIIPDGFYLTFLQLESGYCILEKLISRKSINGKIIENTEKIVLFLSKNEDAFLETIEKGEVHLYENVKSRLNHCISVINNDKIVDILLNKDNIDINNINIIPKQETINKYKKIED